MTTCDSVGKTDANLVVMKTSVEDYFVHPLKCCRPPSTAERAFTKSSLMMTSLNGWPRELERRPYWVRVLVQVLPASTLLAGIVRAEVMLAPLFQDHAVLQRDKPLPVWGGAEPGEAVEVRF